MFAHNNTWAAVTWMEHTVDTDDGPSGWALFDNLYIRVIYNIYIQL